jgi:hypothetical protein
MATEYEGLYIWSSETHLNSADKRQWTICLTLLVIVMLAGIITGAIRGTQIAKEKEKVVEHSSSVSVTAMPATSATFANVGIGSSTTIIKPTASPTPA